MSDTEREYHDETICATEAHSDPTGAVVLPIYQSANFRFASTDKAEAYARGTANPYLYTRHTNPTLESVEEKIAALEHGRRALLFGSGSAATATWCYSFLRPGDRLITSRQLYGGTADFLGKYLEPFNVLVEPVDFNDLETLDCALANAKACWFETPANPTLGIVDGSRVAKLCRKHGVLSAMDNTFATPINQKPLDWGIDWVMHSATKYFGGHDDVIGGVLVAGERGNAQTVYDTRKGVGAVMDPQAAFLIDRGLKTLALRVERQNANALALARWLTDHPKVSRVHYPGLPDHPGHEIAARQMQGFGGVVSVDLAGGYEKALQFIDGLRLIIHATSLGGVSSLVSVPVLTSHVHATADELAASHISRATVRISVGIESIEDLRLDIESALAGV